MLSITRHDHSEDLHTFIDVLRRTVLRRYRIYGSEGDARAQAEGALLVDIMDALLVAGAIADSSTLSVAFRKFKQLEEKARRDSMDDD